MLNGLNEDVKTIANNYEMGFITSLEFVCQYMDELSKVGAEAGLERKLNEVCAPMANHIMGILNGNGKSIEDFKIKK